MKYDKKLNTLKIICISQKVIKEKPNTAYNIWNFRKTSFTMNQQARKKELKKKLDELKYNEKENMNLFMSELQKILRI